jgi:hypothetical protein
MMPLRASDLAVAHEARDPAPPSPTMTVGTVEKDRRIDAAPAGPSTSAPPVAPAAVAEAPVVTTPGGKPIDLGPTMREALANRPAIRIESPADLHAAIESEARDDSWSYRLEAEIRNLLTELTQTIPVTVHAVECRSTLCEMRLSTYDYNARALHEWIGRGGGVARHTMPVANVVTAANGRAELLLILRRTPPSSAASN